jgi:hypothetical protein
MRFRHRRMGMGCAVLLALGAAVAPAAAQGGPISTVQVISLAATAQGQLTLTVLSGSVQTLANINDGTTTDFPTPVQIRTQWNVNPGQTGTVNVIAYFTTPAQALARGSTFIPSSQIRGRVTTGLPTTFTAITEPSVTGGAVTVGTAGGSLRLFSQSISGANKSANRTDNLELQIDRTGQAVLPSGLYAGTLNLRAITQ